MSNQSYIKPEINKEHPRIKNRTPDQQKYRDDLAQVLKANRQLGDVGRRAARVVLENESESAEYISAKENIPQDLAKDLLEYISYSKNPEDLEIDRILKKSKGVSHQKIAELLIEKRYCVTLAKNLEKLKGLDHKKIAELLIEKGDWFALADKLEKFEGLDYQKIAELLVEKKNRFTVRVFTNNLEKLKGLDSKTVELLIKEEREAEQREKY